MVAYCQQSTDGCAKWGVYFVEGGYHFDESLRQNTCLQFLALSLCRRQNHQRETKCIQHDGRGDIACSLTDEG